MKPKTHGIWCRNAQLFIGRYTTKKAADAKREQCGTCDVVIRLKDKRPGRMKPKHSFNAILRGTPVHA